MFDQDITLGVEPNAFDILGRYGNNQYLTRVQAVVFYRMFNHDMTTKDKTYELAADDTSTKFNELGNYR